MSPHAVTIKNVTKKFGDVEAIKDLSFVAPYSGITVLLGPNGAGKTTALRLVTGAFQPSSGSVSTLECAMAKPRDAQQARQQVGVVTAKPSLYDRLTGWDNLSYAASLYDIDTSDSQKLVWEAAKRFDIHKVLDQRVGSYSTGMKTRLALARSILHSPSLLLFDEPTSGLDPESAYKVLELIREMTSEGKTVIMCTHLLPEAENLADHIVVMQKGTAVASGTKESLASRYLPERTTEFVFSGPQPQNSDLLSFKNDLACVIDIRDNEGVFQFVLDDFNGTSECVEYLCAKGWSLYSVIPQEPTLEKLYFAAQQELNAPQGETI